LKKDSQKLKRISKLTAEADDHEVESALVRAQKREIARLTKKADMQRSGEAVLLSYLAEIFKDGLVLKVPKKPRKDTRKTKPEWIGVAHLCDLHFGKTTHNYNSTIAYQRTVLYFHKVGEIIKAQRTAAKIEVVHILLGGDIAEGESVFKGQKLLIDRQVLEQAMFDAPEAIVDGILYLMTIVREIHMWCVVGNHGWDGKKYRIGATNWDRVFYETLKLIFKGTEKLPRDQFKDRIHFHIGDYDVTARVFDWGLLLIHGDRIKGQLGMPWYGIGKKMSGWADILEEPWEYLFMGHFHTLSSITINYRRCFANGSAESGNEYAKENMAASGYPVQRFCFFDAKHGMVNDHPVYLVDKIIPQGRRFIDAYQEKKNG